MVLMHHIVLVKCGSLCAYIHAPHNVKSMNENCTVPMNEYRQFTLLLGT